LIKEFLVELTRSARMARKYLVFSGVALLEVWPAGTRTAQMSEKKPVFGRLRGATMDT
jgi:hypothetical protein